MQLFFVNHLKAGTSVDSPLLHGALQLPLILRRISHQNLTAALEGEIQFFRQMIHDPVSLYAAFCF